MPHYPNRNKIKTIKYPQAPSGKINIAKWEPPFMPNDTGFGFVGVVAEDSASGHLQCSECGKWFQQLPTHYARAHEMTGEQYREKFGLFKSTALKSMRIRLIQSKVISKLQKAGKMGIGNTGNFGFKKKNKHAGNRKGWKKPAEGKNKFGICDLQIMTKIITLGKKLKKTPTLVDIKNEYGGGIISTMHNRYGSYVQYCREKLKLEPCFSNANPRTEKQWKEQLLEEGRIALKKGRKMVITQLLGKNAGRYIYRHFGSFGKYKKELLKSTK